MTVDGVRRLGLRVHPELVRELTEAADERGVTLNWLAEKLLQEGVNNLRPADEMRLTR